RQYSATRGTCRACARRKRRSGFSRVIFVPGGPPLRMTGDAGTRTLRPAFVIMKPFTEQHLALFRRHMVEIIDMHFDLAEDELGKSEVEPDLRRATCRGTCSCRRT